MLSPRIRTHLCQIWRLFEQPKGQERQFLERWKMYFIVFLYFMYINRSICKHVQDVKFLWWNLWLGGLPTHNANTNTNDNTWQTNGYIGLFGIYAREAKESRNKGEDTGKIELRVLSSVNRFWPKETFFSLMNQVYITWKFNRIFCRPFHNF